MLFFKFEKSNFFKKIENFWKFLKYIWKIWKILFFWRAFTWARNRSGHYLNLFSVSIFVKKNHQCAWRANWWQIVWWPKIASFVPQQLPRPCFGPLKGFFELTLCPSRGLYMPCLLPPELQRYKSSVRCAALGAEVQDTTKNSWHKPWLCVCKNTFYTNPGL